MAIKFIDILEPVNPAASAIAKSKQIAGARSVATRADLDTIIPQVLSASYNPADGSHENDAVGQVWYVANENKYYKLTGFSVNTDIRPFIITRNWELFIDSSITASAINNRIDSKLRSGFETQTIFGYNVETDTRITTNAIYMGGYYTTDDKIVISTGGNLFDFPADNGGTLATQNYVNNIESNINNSIQDIVDNSIEPIQTEIDNSIVKFKNIDVVNETEVISNESVSTGTTNTTVSGNITSLQTLLSENSNYDTIKLKSIKHFVESDIITDNIRIAGVEFCNGAEKYGSELPTGWTSYADKPNPIIGPTTSVGTSSTNNVYKYVGESGGYITTTTGWKTCILEADITCVGGRNPVFKYDYIDTADQTIEFSFFVSNASSNTQNIFYITTAGIENSQAYSLAIGNSYDSDQYVAVGYTNSEIGIHSNPKDYATFQQESAGTGDWTILNKYADSKVGETSSVNVTGMLHYSITIGKGELKCIVRNIDTNQFKEFDKIDIPNFKFRYFGFMNDGLADTSRIHGIFATVKHVPLYLHVSYTTQQNSNETYLGHSTNYVTVDTVPSELVWNFDNLSIPTEATTLYTRFAPTTNNATLVNTAAVALLVYTVPTTSGFGYYKGENPFTKFNNATIASEFEMSIYDSNNIDINQSLFAGPDNRNILLSAEDYVKFDRPIASSSIKSVDGNKIGGNISVPFIDGNDTFALVSDIDSVNLQTVLNNQVSTDPVVLNTILTIVKTRVEDVHPILMLGDFSARIGSVYYPDPNQPGPITGFINETVRNPDGSFTTTNTVAGSPLTITDGTKNEHAATVGQVSQMISAAISSSGTSNEIRYIFENPEIVPVNEEAIWNTVIKYKNAAGIAGIDYTNVPVVQVYSKTTGEICYPGVNLVAATENNENYTCVNIILRPVTETIAASQYTAVIMTSAEIA